MPRLKPPPPVPDNFVDFVWHFSYEYTGIGQLDIKMPFHVYQGTGYQTHVFSALNHIAERYGKNWTTANQAAKSIHRHLNPQIAKRIDKKSLRRFQQQTGVENPIHLHKNESRIRLHPVYKSRQAA